VVIYIYEVINAACSEYIDDSVWHFKKSRYSLGVCTTLWKETVGFVTSACLCGTTWLPLDGFSWNLRTVWKFVEKIRVSSNFDKNNRYFTCRPVYIFDNIWLLHRMRNVWDKSCKENQNTHFIFNLYYCFPTHVSLLSLSSIIFFW